MKLILFSGLPATGKSSLAQQIASEFGYPMFNKDHFESILYNNKLTEGRSVHGYHLLLKTAELQLSLGLSVVLDAVFPLIGFREHVQEMVKQYRAKLYIIHTYCSDEKLHQHRLTNRSSQVPWTDVDWERVQDIRASYTKWQEDEILSIDAINSLDDNLQAALDYIRN